MSQVFTGNVFISTSREATKKVFFSKRKVINFKDQLQTLTEKELARSFVSTPYKNTNLLELDYSWGGDLSNKSALRLRFLETDSLFELFFTNKSVSVNVLKKLFKQLETLNDSEKSKVNAELFDSNSDTILNDGRIFFAFGVGDNLADWAGPYVANLVRGEILNTTDGIKQIELFFMPNDDFFLTNYIENKINDGLDGAINKYNRIISNRNLVRAKASIRTSFLDIKGNEHKLITSLLKAYIQQITGNRNVIVLIPDIDNVFLNKLQSDNSKKIEYNSSQYSLMDSISDAIANESITPILDYVDPSDPNNIQEGYFKRKSELVESWGTYKNIYREFLNKLYIGLDIKSESPYTKSIPISLDQIQDETPNPALQDVELVMQTSSDDNESVTPNLPDFWFPIQKFIDGARDYYGNYSNQKSIKNDIELFEEDDLKTIGMMFDAGFIQDSDKAVTILGSRDIVNNLLYLSKVTSLSESLQPIELGAINKEDYKKYFNAKYRAKYFTEFLSVPINSSFGENVLIKDELALDSVDVQSLKLENIPVFRYNLRNSNILGINVKYNGSYISAYNLAYRKQKLLPFVNSKTSVFIEEARKVIPQKLVENFSKLISPDEFKDIPAILTKVTKLLSEDNLTKNPSLLLNFDFNLKPSDTLTKEQFITYLSLLVAANYSLGNGIVNPSKPFIEVKDSDDALIQATITDQLQKIALKISIKTLPFFKLSRQSIIGKRVLLLASHSSIIGTDYKKKLAVYSGLFRISSFRHILNNGEMYSEFTLIGTPNDPINEQIVTTTGNITMKELLEKLQKSVFQNKVDIRDQIFGQYDSNYLRRPQN